MSSEEDPHEQITSDAYEDLELADADAEHVAGGDTATASTVQHKHLAGVKYEDITIDAGTGMAK